MLPRLAVASVWIYQGLWCKLLGHAPQHQKIIETIPLVQHSWGRAFLAGLGALECVLAAWVLSGIRAREVAIAQTILLVSMNTVALWRARHLISDPIGMLLQNCVFLTLAWIAAGQLNYSDGAQRAASACALKCYAAGA